MREQIAMRIITVCYMLFLTISTSFGVMIEVSIDELTKQSSDIISGKVIDIKSEWNDSHDFIFTTVTIEIDNIYKGILPKASSVSVLIPGGEIDSVGLRVEHSPHFENTESVILFLRTLDSDNFGVTAWEQGKYTVRDNVIYENGQSIEEFINTIKSSLESDNSEGGGDK